MLSRTDSGALQMGNYTLKCIKTNEKFDDNYTLHFTDGALVQAEYNENFQPVNELGVWRYFDWMPTEKISSQVAGTVTYKAEKLGEIIFTL